MYNFVKKYKAIFAFAVISVLIVILYAITYNLPDYFHLEGWYVLLNNLAISYIAAFIFFVLQVYIPENNKNKRAFTVLRPLFLDLIKFIEITIEVCNKYVSCDDTGKIIINWTNKEDMRIYFTAFKENYEDGNTTLCVTKEEIENLENKFNSKIDSIKSKTEFFMCDQQILDAFSNIELSAFYKSHIKAALMFSQSFVKFNNFHICVNELEQIKDNFKKCCGITDKYIIRDSEKTEIALYDAIFKKKALQLTSIYEFNKTTYKEYFNNILKDDIKDDKIRDSLAQKLVDQVVKK